MPKTKKIQTLESKMNDFRMSFNPLIPLGRFLGSLFFVAMIFINNYLFFRDFKANDIKELLPIILMTIFMGLAFQMVFRPLITSTKNYIIRDNAIEEYNFLTFSTRTIDKNEIKGFSTSIIPYNNIPNFKQIIIYLKDGSKIDLMQYAYFNFKKIKPALIDKKYIYLGHEPYVWKWVNSRVYKYDK